MNPLLTQMLGESASVEIQARKAAMRSAQNKTVSKKDRLAARLTRGSQPGRQRAKGKRFTKDNQPKRLPGRPKGATNLMTRELKEAILGGCSDVGENGKGKGGLRGYMRRMAKQDTKTMGTLLRAILPTEVTVEEKQDWAYQTIEEAKAELERLGIPSREVYRLEHYKGPLIDVEADEST
jgi:hypothetical protein